MAMRLRPYQSEACRKIVGEFEQGIRKTLLILPTGCGKTVVFNGVAFRYAYNANRTPSGGKVLILAHQNLLIDQAAEKFRSIMGIKVSREKGRCHALDSDLPITVSSMQTMQNRLDLFTRDYFDLIIVDEAHHIMTAGYQKIIEYFNTAKLLGVTATPDRADGKKLTCFETIAFHYTIQQAQKDGYLAHLNVVRSPLKIDLGKARKSHGDIIGSDIDNALEPHLHEIAEEIRRLAKGRRIVCFVPLIKTAQKAAEIFSHYGFRSEWTAGADKERAQKLERFADGEYDIIFNSMLLTEGWDCPETDCVVVLRPTESRALYVQMVGRGLRLAPGKKDCLLIDFLFQHDSFDLASPDDILNEQPREKRMMPADFIGGGGGERKDAETRLAEKLEEAAQAAAMLKNAHELPEYQEAIKRAEWENQQLGLFDPQCSRTQRNKLKAMGINPDSVTYSQAQAILRQADEMKPVSDAQRYRLEKLGYDGFDIAVMNFSSAKKALRQAKAQGRW